MSTRRSASPEESLYGGFNFDNCKRNDALSASGVLPSKMRKTGTTIAGVVFADGIVLGADTRATEGSIVADKNCEKIHYLTPNIYCCGAGTAADTEQVTGKQYERESLLERNG